MIYRILTEDKGNIAQIVSKHFDAFTIIRAQGYWKGTAENSVVIELDSLGLADMLFSSRVHILATDIKTTNNQDAVLVQKITAESELV